MRLCPLNLFQSPRRNLGTPKDVYKRQVLVAGLVLPFGHDIWVIGALLVILSVLAAFESPTVQALSLIHI